MCSSNADGAATAGRIRLTHATDADREAIYRLRHAVFAVEIGQHAPNLDERLTDRLDAFNHYLAAWQDGELAGFVSITPPGHGYSVDKYFARDHLPLPIDGATYEVRLLAVHPGRRQRLLAPLLMYAALRFVQSRGGTHIIAIGRGELGDLYRRCGLLATGQWTRSGQVSYELMHAPVERLADVVRAAPAMLARLEQRTDWQLDMPLRRQAPCFHGGRFFEAVGERFDRLDSARDVINADVLDAWFPPAPGVLSALRDHLEWLLRTSPPLGASGLNETIANVRGVSPASVLVGAGSSDLIYLAMRQWVGPASRVLLLDPTYGEYAHLLEQVIGCRVDRLELRRGDRYDLKPEVLADRLAEGYDLAVLVNPNSPTGRHLPRPELEAVLRGAPARTRIWLDETYVDYAGPEQSLERFAATSANVCVCKSMSKAYALSGARVAYLVATPPWLETLRAVSPPWAVSLLGQVAAVRALEDAAYYRARWRETAELRDALAAELRLLGLDVVASVTSFLLAHLPTVAPDVTALQSRCEAEGLFLRDVANMGRGLDRRAIRLAVKDAGTNQRMVEILARALQR